MKIHPMKTHNHTLILLMLTWYRPIIPTINFTEKIAHNNCHLMYNKKICT